MKRLNIVLLFALLPTGLLAQSINGVPLKDLDVEYIRIIERLFLVGDFKTTLEYDLGAKYPPNSRRLPYLIVDANNQQVQFDYMVDALRFFERNGFDLAYVHSVAHGNNATINYYWLRKKK